jgi:hypothetical protein
MQSRILLTRKNRWVVLVSLLLVALTVLAGCGPRAAGGEMATRAGEGDLVVSLPALVLDVQTDGSVSLGGQSLAGLGAQVGQDLSALSFPPDVVDMMSLYNIQHIQIETTADGLLILINGQAIPSIAWDGEKLVATAEALQSFGASIALLDKVLPLIQTLGIGVTLRFPVAQGAEAVPIGTIETGAAEEAMAAQRAFLESVGAPPEIQITVNYAADGSYEVAGLTAAELQQIPGVNWSQLNLAASQITALQNAGIQELGLATNADGIFISINGETLPYLTWADGRINNLLNLAMESGLLSTLPGMDPATLDLVAGFVPVITASNVSLRVVFP